MAALVCALIGLATLPLACRAAPLSNAALADTETSAQTSAATSHETPPVAPTITPATPPTPTPRVVVPSNARERMQQGMALAAIGNCSGCHTRAGQAPFSGGVPLETPFGTIYGSNITPDADTGIGAWTLAEFTRAMRLGIERDGTHLYPAFPYDHFSHASDSDLEALYRFVMSRTPIHSRPPSDQLDFPYSVRGLMVFWNALYLEPGPLPVQDLAPQADLDKAVARGAYLSTSLGHCDSCHSPRNALGAEVRDAAFSGGTVDGWYAPALNRSSPSPTQWTRASLMQYLSTGIADQHAMAGGPMRDVVQSLARANPDDVAAIAAYLVDLMGTPSPVQQASEAASRQRALQPLAQSAFAADQRFRVGAAIYQASCANCHDQGRGNSSSHALPLALAIAAYDPEPASLLRIVREGIEPIPNGADRLMPAFGASLTDAQISALAAFIRAAAANAPPWPHLADAVKYSLQ